MKKSQTSITEQLQPVIRIVIRYRKFLFMIAVLVMMAFLVFQINQLSSAQPSETAVDEQLQTVSLPKLDQHIIDTIQQLQDQNVEVRSLFDQARDNPFNE